MTRNPSRARNVAECKRTKLANALSTVDGLLECFNEAECDDTVLTSPEGAARHSGGARDSADLLFSSICDGRQANMMRNSKFPYPTSTATTATSALPQASEMLPTSSTKACSVTSPQTDSLHADKLEFHATSKRGPSYPIPEIIFEMPPPAVNLRIKVMHEDISSINSSSRSPLACFAIDENLSGDDDTSSVVSYGTIDSVDSLSCAKRRLRGL